MATVVAFYERVSTEDQEAHGFGLAVQRRSLEQLVAANPDWIHPPHLTFRDIGSGGNTKRPGLMDMLAAAERQEFSILIVPDIDRLSRSVRDAGMITEELERAGVRIVYETMPSAEDTAEVRLQQNMLRAFAEFEKDKIARRLMNGRREKVKQGKVVGQGVPPYGYRWRTEIHNDVPRIAALEVDPVTGPIAREILDALLSESAASIARKLTARNVEAPRGGEWSAKTVNSLGRSRVYLGEWRYGGVTIANPDVVPPIISEAHHQAIQNAFAQRLIARKSRKHWDPYYLRGLLTCGVCGGQLKTTWNNGYRYYSCKRRCIPDVPADAIAKEAHLVVSATLLNPEAIQRMLDERMANERAAHDRQMAEVQRLDKKIATVTTKLQNLAERVGAVEGEYFLQAVLKQAADAEQELKRLSEERKCAAAAIVKPITEDDAQWLAAELDKIGWMLADPTCQVYYQTVNLRGVVTLSDAEHGIQMGRRHWYAVEWTAGLSGSALLNPRTSYRLEVTPGDIGRIIPLATTMPMAAD